MALNAEVTLVDALDGDLVLHGALSGSGELLKVGPQALVLSGSNTYAGGTVVEDGTLDVLSPYSLPDGSSLTVGSDATIFDDPTCRRWNRLRGQTLIAVPEAKVRILVAARGGW